jgi:uncharacterized membrane protein
MEIYLDLVRLAHIFSGILWIGVLYFYNFIQALALPKMDASARPHYQTSILPFSLNIFRWAALSTLVFGLAYIGGISADIGSDYWSTGQFKSIAIGGGLGIIMAYNVWFIIWPKQQKIIAAVRAKMADDSSPAPEPQWGRTALLASRTNTMLSIPMLFFMIAARHLPSLWN